MNLGGVDPKIYKRELGRLCNIRNKRKSPNRVQKVREDKWWSLWLCLFVYLKLIAMMKEIQYNQLVE